MFARKLVAIRKSRNLDLFFSIVRIPSVVSWTSAAGKMAANRRLTSHEAGRHFLADFSQSCRETGQNRGHRREVKIQETLVAQGFSSSGFPGFPASLSFAPL
jgi:hypothetical protein